jgi:two-component system OmpR family sensor kinase
VRVAADPGGGSALLEVADAGPGMTADVADRIFERFYRADVSRTRASGGSGLGLSIVASLVQAHGGRIELDTAPGRGALFRVVLPVDGPATQRGPGRSASEAPVPSGSSPFADQAGT